MKSQHYPVEFPVDHHEESEGGASVLSIMRAFVGDERERSSWVKGLIM